MADIDRDAYGLIRVGSWEWLGYAWVCVADESPSFEDTVIVEATGRLRGPAAIRGYRAEALAVLVLFVVNEYGALRS